MSRRIALLAMALLLPAMVFLGSAAFAAKPGGGGGGGTGGGTIFFIPLSQQLSTMDSDGSNKTALPSGVAFWPSRALHGGHRWFLDVRDIAGETYPSGTTRREIFAVRGDGNPSYTVQLTNQADLEGDGLAAWKPGDGAISWVARRWSGGSVVEGGVYSATMEFDADGNVTGLSAQPAAPAIAFDLVLWTNAGGYFTGDLAPDLYEYDWSPGGDKIVYARFSAQSILTADLAGARQLLTSGFGRMPAWSPDGSRIAYNSSDGISTITPAGTGKKTLVKKSPNYGVGGPIWSPTGSHVAYTRDNFGAPALERLDVYRVAVDGSGNTNLTGDIAGSATPRAWR